MQYDPNKHHRRSIRLAGYDYSRVGAYFVTTVTKDRALLFGEVQGGMQLNEFGDCVAAMWCDIPTHFQQVDIDEFVVMPNHIHGIVVISDGVEASLAAPGAAKQVAGKLRPKLGQIIAYFKYLSTKQINAVREMSGTPLWQRNYYERIVRNAAELERTRQYIHNNPFAWSQDVENPARSDTSTSGRGNPAPSVAPSE